MLVRAIRDHFDGAYRKAGDEFEVVGKKISKHCEKIAEKTKFTTEEIEDGDGGDLSVAPIDVSTVRN
jgi:hypothetical protein